MFTLPQFDGNREGPSEIESEEESANYMFKVNDPMVNHPVGHGALKSGQLPCSLLIDVSDIPQVDGNESVGDNSSEEDVHLHPFEPFHIPTNGNTILIVIGNRKHHTKKENSMKPVRKTIRRTNKKIQVAKTLPTVAVSNIRSLIPKVNNYKNDLNERNVHLSILSEVWEQVVNTDFEKKI